MVESPQYVLTLVASLAELGVRRVYLADTLGVLEPRMNHYRRQREPVGTPAVMTMAKEDVYLSMASYDPASKLLGLRAFKNPMVVWIWIGTAILTFGALLAAWPMRRLSARVAVREPVAVPAASAGEVGPA